MRKFASVCGAAAVVTGGCGRLDFDGSFLDAIDDPGDGGIFGDQDTTPPPYTGPSTGEGAALLITTTALTRIGPTGTYHYDANSNAATAETLMR